MAPQPWPHLPSTRPGAVVLQPSLGVVSLRGAAAGRLSHSCQAASRRLIWGCGEFSSSLCLLFFFPFLSFFFYLCVQAHAHTPLPSPQRSPLWRGNASWGAGAAAVTGSSASAGKREPAARREKSRAESFLASSAVGEGSARLPRRRRCVISRSQNAAAQDVGALGRAALCPPRRINAAASRAALAALGFRVQPGGGGLVFFSWYLASVEDISAGPIITCLLSVTWFVYLPLGYLGEDR